MAHDVFISHSTSNRPVANAVCAALESAGILCRIAPRDYYASGPKDKAFVTEQIRQFLAALPMRSFDVNDVKVQDSSKPMIATVIFDVRYSARDVYGNLVPATPA